MRIFRGFLIVVEGHFGSTLDHQNFLLDTGTSPSIINTELAAPLGLSKSPAFLASLGRDSKAQAAVLPEIEIGPIRVDSLPILLSNLSQLETDLGIPIAGIIGMDLLSKASFRLDYDKKCIEFGKFSRDGIAVPLPEGTSIALAEVNWGGTPVRLMVDTGSDQLVLLGKQRPSNSAANSVINAHAQTQSAASVSDRLSVQELTGADITLAGKKFSRPKVYWVPGSDTSDFDGLLGVRSLGFRRFSFDSQHRTIYLSQ